jgi:hypothetical protein
MIIEIWDKVSQDGIGKVSLLKCKGKELCLRGLGVNKTERRERNEARTRVEV